MKCFIKEFFSIYHQIRSFLRIWSHILKKSLMENFIFCFRYRGWGKRHIMPQTEKLVLLSFVVKDLHSWKVCVRKDPFLLVITGPKGSPKTGLK